MQRRKDSLAWKPQDLRVKNLRNALFQFLFSIREENHTDISKQAGKLAIGR
jgi:hypothetical protein